MSYQEITADQIWHLAEDESRLFTCDFTNLLASGETITIATGISGGFTYGVTTNAGITVATPAANSGTVTRDDGETIAIGKAVQVRLTEASATIGQTYDVVFWVGTSASNRLTQVCRLKVVD